MHPAGSQVSGVSELKKAKGQEGVPRKGRHQMLEHL